MKIPKNAYKACTAGSPYSPYRKPNYDGAGMGLVYFLLIGLGLALLCGLG